MSLLSYTYSKMQLKLIHNVLCSTSKVTIGIIQFMKWKYSYECTLENAMDGDNRTDSLLKLKMEDWKINFTNSVLTPGDDIVF